MSGDSSAKSTGAVGDGPMSWWKGSAGLHSFSWGGAQLNSRMCDCALTGDCILEKNCNCDSGRDAVDEGDVEERMQLPVSAVFIGDTQPPHKWVNVSVGPLICSEPLSLDAVTFSEPDSRLELSTAPADASRLEVSLEFRTTRSSGSLLFGMGIWKTEWLKLYFAGKRRIGLEMVMGGRVTELEWTGEALDDDDWHRVAAYLSPWEAVLVVDGVAKAIPGPIRLPLFRPTWKLGHTSEFGSGFLGVFRSIFINSDNFPLRDLLEKGQSVNVLPGVVHRCSDNLCSEGAACLEFYSHYECGCAQTPFVGPHCLTDVGVEFEDSWLEFLADSVRRPSFRPGFQTRSPGVSLLLGRSDVASIRLSLDSSGFLLLKYSNDQKSQSLTDDRGNYTDGAFYDVRIFISKMGNRLVLEVSGYETLEIALEDKIADWRKLTIWTVGDAELHGCLARLQLGGDYPLKESANSSRVRWHGLHALGAAVCGAPRPSLVAPVAVQSVVDIPSPSVVVVPVEVEDRTPPLAILP